MGTYFQASPKEQFHMFLSHPLSLSFLILYFFCDAPFCVLFPSIVLISLEASRFMPSDFSQAWSLFSVLGSGRVTSGPLPVNLVPRLSSLFSLTIFSFHFCQMSFPQILFESFYCNRNLKSLQIQWEHLTWAPVKPYDLMPANFLSSVPDALAEIWLGSSFSLLIHSVFY